MSYLGFQEIEKNLSNAKFVDASDIILKLRLIKSSNEINYIRKVINGRDSSIYHME